MDTKIISSLKIETLAPAGAAKPPSQMMHVHIQSEPKIDHDVYLSELVELLHAPHNNTPV